MWNVVLSKLGYCKCLGQVSRLLSMVSYSLFLELLLQNQCTCLAKLFSRLCPAFCGQRQSCGEGAL